MPRSPRNAPTGSPPATDTHKPTREDHDNPWKQAITGAFPEFLAFYFPAAHAAIDWMMRLPPAFDHRLWQDITEHEKGSGMRYVTSFERISIEKAMEKGIGQGRAQTLARLLSRRFGPLPEAARARLAEATAEQLELWTDRVLDAPTLQAVLDTH